MRYRKIAEQSDLAIATSTIRKSFESKKGVITKRVKLGFPGDHVERDVKWVPSLRIWYVRPEKKVRSHFFWLPYGVKEPKGRSTLHITIETNLAWKRSAACSIVIDNSGRKYLAHSGRITGRKPWISQKNFLRACLSHGFRVVECEDKKSRILVGRLDHEISSRIARFVKLARSFKDGDSRALKDLPRKKTYKQFQPKFSGKLKYKRTGEVEAELLHEKVAASLERFLRPRKCEYDQHNDLVLCGKGGQPIALYEIKTATESQSIYTGVGQLVLNGSTTFPVPKRVLVLPGKVSPETASAIASVGIELLQYKWKGKRPLFPAGAPPKRVLPSE